MRGQSPGRARLRATRGSVVANLSPLRVEVEEELGRVRAQPDEVDLVRTLPDDPGPDQLLAEHAALRQGGVVGLERVERVCERPGHLCDLAVRLLEQVEVRGRARVEA